MGKKSPLFTLEDLWDLEDKFTAMIGNPSGAKLAPREKVAKRPEPPQKSAKTTHIKVRKLDPGQIAPGSKAGIKVGNAEEIKTDSLPMSAREFAAAMAPRKIKSVKLAAEEIAKARL